MVDIKKLLTCIGVKVNIQSITSWNQNGQYIVLAELLYYGQVSAKKINKMIYSNST